MPSLVPKPYTLSPRSGFSLIELLLTIVLIAAISAILIRGAGGLHSRRRTDLLSVAGKAASQQIEKVRNQDFLSVGPALNQTCSSDYTDSTKPSYLPGCRIDQSVSSYGGDANIKQVSITVSWTYQSKSQLVVMETLISPGGL